MTPSLSCCAIGAPHSGQCLWVCRETADGTGNPEHICWCPTESCYADELEPELTAVSLFAGIGGIDLALTRAGVKVVAAVEVDPAARGVLADRFPDVTLFEDVREVTGDQLRAAGFVPERGILAAGWPCQGNSVAGRRGGLDDPRSGLWRHVVRLLAETSSRWFLGENVPGLLSVNRGRDVAVVRSDLAQLGYWWAERILDAQHFGVPQRRRRVFFVGHLGGTGAEPVQVLLEPDRGGGDSAPSRPARPGTAIAHTLRASGGGADDNDARTGRLVALDPFNQAETGQITQTFTASRASAVPHVVGPTATLTARYAPGAGGGSGDMEQNMLIACDAASMAGRVTHALTAEGHDASEDGTGRGTPLIAFDWQAGGNDHLRIPGESSSSLRTARRDAVAHQAMVRRLTPTECERLQGVPDGWTTTSNGRPQKDAARYRQLGNSVALPCVEWIARRLVAAS